jgi:predicted phosphodiesterase
MRFGLASDSHGDVEVLARVLERLIEAKVDKILFLGGLYADVDRAVARAQLPASAPPPTGAGDAFLDVFRGALAAQAGVADGERERLRKRIVRVASRSCPEYEGGSAPRKLIELLGGHVACLVHDKSELVREDIANAVILLHGNSAQAALVQIGPRVFATPGHLRRQAPEGRPPTYAILELEPHSVALIVHGLDGAELRRERADLGGKSKMVVR